jgi:hypothetical protein
MWFLCLDRDAACVQVQNAGMEVGSEQEGKGNFSTNDVVTARFRTFDQYGTVRFDYSRAIAVP